MSSISNNSGNISINGGNVIAASINVGGISCSICEEVGKGKKQAKFWYSHIDPSKNDRFYACSSCMYSIYENDEERKNSSIENKNKCDVFGCEEYTDFCISHEGLYSEDAEKDFSFRCAKHAGIL